MRFLLGLIAAAFAAAPSQAISRWGNGSLVSQDQDFQTSTPQATLAALQVNVSQVRLTINSPTVMISMLPPMLQIFIDEFAAKYPEDAALTLAQLRAKLQSSGAHWAEQTTNCLHVFQSTSTSGSLTTLIVWAQGHGLAVWGPETSGTHSAVDQLLKNATLTGVDCQWK